MMRTVFPRVHSLVVVPSVLWRDDTVSDEDDLGVDDVDVGGVVTGNRYVVLVRPHGDRCLAYSDRRGRRAGVADEFHRLHVAAVRVSRGQA
jgi:hypothetical protein